MSLFSTKDWYEEKNTGVHKIEYSPHARGGNFFKVNDVLGKNIHFPGKLLNKKGEEIQNCGGKKFKQH